MSDASPPVEETLHERESVNMGSWNEEPMLEEQVNWPGRPHLGTRALEAAGSEGRKRHQGPVALNHIA